jgi:hypothetical protein
MADTIWVMTKRKPKTKKKKRLTQAVIRKINAETNVAKWAKQMDKYYGS